MRTSIMISVIKVQDQNLGIETDDTYTYSRLHFDSADFTGFWIVKDNDHEPDEICIYIGGNKFFCKYNTHNLRICEEILDSKDKPI